MMQLQPTRRSTSQGLWVAAFTLTLTATAVTGPGAGAPPAASSTVGRFIDSGPSLHQYRALRRMHAASERFDHEGWMDAWTEFDASGFRYEIVAERGSNAVRNKVLRTLLKREQELIAKGDFGRGELTPENYEFGEEISGPDGRYIPIKPKRKDSMLVDGRMVLDADGELLRVEGLLARSPSFWTSQVEVIRRYTRVDGVRVPIAVESIAKVKFAGRSRLNVEYEYESVNGHPVKTAGLPAIAGISRSAGQ